MKRIITTISLTISIITNAQQFFTQDITATKAFQGVLGSATLQIDDLDNDGLITRPLIVAEGFDTGLLGVENEFGENNIQDFIDEATDFTGNLALEIQDYDIIYINWDNPRDFLQRNAFVLEAVITWVNNEKEPNAAQNVVLGQSMGGVLARYALADMETDDDPNTNHDTSLYISHDAPHQGANIPVSIQYFARHMISQFVSTPLGDFEFAVSEGNVSIEDIENVLNAPGTKQLLANYIAAPVLFQDPMLDDFKHEAWQTELKNLGYPTQTRNIAISNGNHCAFPQDFPYNSSLFRMQGTARTAFLTDLLGSALGIADDLVLAVLFDEPGLIVGALPGNSKFTIDFNAKSLPVANTTANIYKGKITFTKKLLWLTNININLTDVNYNNPVNLAFDNYAGGNFELFDEIDDLNIPGINDSNVNDIVEDLFGRANISFTTSGSFGFIPTPSALDVGEDVTPLTDGDYFIKYNAVNPPAAPKNIPFHNFTTAYTPNNNLNEEHISFNERNGNWLASELDAALGNEEIFDCSFACGGEDLITGVDQFCTGSRTFSVPAGADTYQWQFFPDPIPLTDAPLIGNATIISSTNTNVIAVNHTGNRSGWYNLRVVINSNRCNVANLVHTKRVYIGAPTVESISVVSDTEAGAHISPSINNCEIPLRLNFAPNDFEVTDIEWEKITTDVLWSRDFSNLNNRYVYLYPECNQEFKFRVRAKNSCGFWSPWRELTYDVTECPTNCQSPSSNVVSDNFILYPVPANSVLNFDVVDNPSWDFPSSSPFTNLLDLDPAAPTTVTYPRVRLYISFYNNMGTLVHSTIIQGLPNQIDVSSLPTGNYIMTVEYLGQIETHNIQII